MSGSPVLIAGGTNETVLTGCERAFIASSAKVPSSEAGRSVVTSFSLALAMLSNFVTTVAGESCWSIAFITHFCRAIRE